jgi:hypothetical protein
MWKKKKNVGELHTFQLDSKTQNGNYDQMQR